MKPLVFFVTRIMVYMLLAMGAILWAWMMSRQLYQYRSPLQERAPASGDPVGPQATRRVVVVLVDALRYDTSLNGEWMPTLARLRERGAWAKMTSRPPSYSQTGYTTLFTGAWPEINDSAAFNLTYDTIHPWTQDNLFSAAARQGLGTAVAGYYWLERLIPSEAVKAGAYVGLEGEQSDLLALEAALPWLKAPEEFSLVLIHLTQVDYAGHHQGGLASNAVQQAARRADDVLTEILHELDLNEDTLLLVSDHGQLDTGGHGGPDPVTLSEPFVLVGKGVRPGAYDPIQMVDVAPTVSALLGLNLPAVSQGQVLSTLLDLPVETLAALPLLEARQQKRLYQAYTAAIAQSAESQEDGPHGKLSRLANLSWRDWLAAILGRARPALEIKGDSLKEELAFADRDAAAWRAAVQLARSSRLSEERLLRGLFALPLLLVTGFAIRRWRPRLKPETLPSSLLYLSLLAVFYLSTGRQTYSYSSSGALPDFALATATSGAAALLIAWLFWAWRSGLVRLFAGADPNLPFEAARRTLDLVSVLLGVLALPVLIHYVVNGFSASWALPNLTVQFWGQFALLNVAVLVIAGVALCGMLLVTGFGALLIRTSPIAVGYRARSARSHAAIPPADPPSQNA